MAYRISYLLDAVAVYDGSEESADQVAALIGADRVSRLHPGVQVRTAAGSWVTLLPGWVTGMTADGKLMVMAPDVWAGHAEEIPA
jgi:hypothetical protein